MAPKTTLLVFACVLYGVFGDAPTGVLTLDFITFDKIVDGTKNVLVKFDKVQCALYTLHHTIWHQYPLRYSVQKYNYGDNKKTVKWRQQMLYYHTRLIWCGHSFCVSPYLRVCIYSKYTLHISPRHMTTFSMYSGKHLLNRMPAVLSWCWQRLRSRNTDPKPTRN